MSAIKFSLLGLLLVCRVHADEPKKFEVEIVTDAPYRSGETLTEYERERCHLDIYLPKNKQAFPTLVWFHGGGLKSGDKSPNKSNDAVNASLIARSFAEVGIAVVVPNYRLSPRATFPAYIEDAAAAVLWVTQQMPKYGADSRSYFVAGHSAGGYLSLMLAMDPHYLENVGVKQTEIAGVIPVSGQTMTHYTVREERGIGKYTITADEAAPVHFIRAETPPILALYADGDLPARAEENMYLVSMMKDAGNKRIEGIEVTNRTHGTIASEIIHPDDPARLAILEFLLSANR